MSVSASAVEIPIDAKTYLRVLVILLDSSVSEEEESDPILTLSSS